MLTRSLFSGWRLSMHTTAVVSRSGHARLAMVGLFAMSCAAPMATTSPARPVPTSLPPRNYSRIESEVLAALNQARTNPAVAATWLEELAGYYSGTRLKRPWAPITLLTTEGVAAVREAITA